MSDGKVSIENSGLAFKGSGSPNLSAMMPKISKPSDLSEGSDPMQSEVWAAEMAINKTIEELGTLVCQLYDRLEDVLSPHDEPAPHEIEMPTVSCRMAERIVNRTSRLIAIRTMVKSLISRLQVPLP